MVVRPDWGSHARDGAPAEDDPSRRWHDMELFPDDLDRIADSLMAGIELVPALGEEGLEGFAVVQGEDGGLFCEGGRDTSA